jgi:hypothetical protein
MDVLLRLDDSYMTAADASINLPPMIFEADSLALSNRWTVTSKTWISHSDLDLIDSLRAAPSDRQPARSAECSRVPTKPFLRLAKISRNSRGPQ